MQDARTEGEGQNRRNTAGTSYKDREGRGGQGAACGPPSIALAHSPQGCQPQQRPLGHPASKPTA